MLREIAASYLHVHDRGLRLRIVLIYSFLVGLNLAAWATALVLFWDSPSTLGLCLLAYGFGLRHAVDADHIAAIDNVTRKLMRERKKPVAVGFFFSLGHSTVVMLMCLAVVLSANVVRTRFPEFQETWGVIGATVSATFLILLAAINFAVFLDVWRAFRAARAGAVQSEEALDELLAGGGLFARILRPLFRLVTRSWHMYPVGFLFGLGFDTATEIALLSIAATQAAQQAPLWSIMVFPLLFTAGMSLIDTTDGVVMLGVYGWALVKPMRKLYYNMTITLISFVIALVVGGLQALNLLAAKLGLEGGLWSYVGIVGENSGLIGYSIIAVMVLGWIVAIVIHRCTHWDRVECAVPVPSANLPAGDGPTRHGLH